MIDWQAQVIAPTVAVFGQPVVLTRAAAAYPITGVFDEAYTEVDVANGMPVASLSPCLGVNLADLPVMPRQGDRVLIPPPVTLGVGAAPVTPTAYIVREVRLDGHGWARLMLNLNPVLDDVLDPTAQDV